MKRIKKIITALLLAVCMAAPVAALAEDGGGTDKNIFESIYETVLENVDEIFSALAFVGTMILGFAYKRGLTPKLTGAVSKISDAVGKVREESRIAMENTEGGIESLSARILSLENALELFSGEVAALEEKLGTRAALEAERERFGTVLSSQVDMLYDIFMSSSLPQYQKEKISERVGMMKKELTGYDKAKE